ncbi:hypothetical protein [Longispora albida]|uniref:hypothetical protein n=1 Tax=Longispora albida TaxID=203523 RepID=UPI000370DEC7|nr:hypothetical protein [Longispora albida]
MDERDGFAPQESLRAGEPDRAGVLLKEAGGRLRVELVVSLFGMPRRWRRPPSVWLERGEWVRWQVNYRFSWPALAGGAWSYRLDTLNLAFGPVGAAAFLGSPDRLVDERDHLR